MGSFHSIAVALLGIATCTSLAVVGYALHAWRRRGDQSILLLAVLMTTTAMWAAGEFLLWLPWPGDSTVFWLWLLYPAHFGLPVAWVVFALQFGGYERFLTSRTVAGLSILPVSTLAVVWIDPLSPLYVGSVGHESLATSTVNEYGPLFFLSTTYNYALMLAGLWLLCRLAYRSRGIYRGQTIAIAVAAVVPLVTNLYLVLRTIPIDVNVTPIAFTVSGTALGYAVFRYRLLDVVPVARESVVEHIRDGMVVVDDEGRIVDVNAMARRLLTADGHRLIGTDASAIGLGDRSIATLLDADGDVELAVETDEKVRFVSVRSMSLDAAVGCDVLVLQDVTERRSTERRYQAFIENATDIVTVLDPDGTIRYQSPAVERVLGYSPEEMIDETAFEYIHPSDHDRVFDIFSAGVVSDGLAIRTDYRMRHADGGWRTVESTGRNLIDEPAVEGIVVNSRDVTERHRRESDLERANERLDEFAGVVSHDLRNPLSVAQGHLELLDERVDDDAIPVIREQCERMESIIDDALALARTGAVVDRTEPVSLEQSARFAWGNVDTGTAVLEVVDDRRFEADRDKLLRALENLFRNCIEHATVEREDAPSVTVEVGVTPGGFYIADDGPGIPTDARERVFELGYTSSCGGTGLGLSIVSQIARAHGWTIEATDGADGSRFEITIDRPVESDEAVDDVSPNR